MFLPLPIYYLYMSLLDFSCCTAVKKYGIQSGVTWGSASKEVQDKWTQKKCNLDNNVASGTCPQGKSVFS